MTEALTFPTPQEFETQIMDYHHAHLLARQTRGVVTVDRTNYNGYISSLVKIQWGDITFNPRKGTLEDKEGTLVDVKGGKVRIEQDRISFTRKVGSDFSTRYGKYLETREEWAAILVAGKIQIPSTPTNPS